MPPGGPTSSPTPGRGRSLPWESGARACFTLGPGESAPQAPCEFPLRSDLGCKDLRADRHCQTPIQDEPHSVRERLWGLVCGSVRGVGLSCNGFGLARPPCWPKSVGQGGSRVGPTPRRRAPPLARGQSSSGAWARQPHGHRRADVHVPTLSPFRMSACMCTRTLKNRACRTQPHPRQSCVRKRGGATRDELMTRCCSGSGAHWAGGQPFGVAAGCGLSHIQEHAQLG